MPLDEAGTTYRDMVLRRYPDLKINHVHHAGNSSGVVDGAAAILLSSPAYASAHGLTPRARVVAIANIGDDPTLMLNAPVPAARKVLAKAGLGIGDIDIFEVNEAFAVVAEKFIGTSTSTATRSTSMGAASPSAIRLGPRAACSSARPWTSWSAETASSASSPCARRGAWPRRSSSSACDRLGAAVAAGPL